MAEFMDLCIKIMKIMNIDLPLKIATMGSAI